jgi:hypothetical protein
MTLSFLTPIVELGCVLYSVLVLVLARSSHVMSCHVMSCQVMSCHVMSCHVMSCHVMSCHVMSCHVISSHLSRSRQQTDRFKDALNLATGRDTQCVKSYLIVMSLYCCRSACSLIRSAELLVMDSVGRG